MAGVRRGLAVRSGMARTEISAPPQGGVSPLPEAVYIRLPYTAQSAFNTIIPASRGGHALQQLKYEAVSGVKGRSPFNH
ncbi:hypothetical protein [Succinimonas sp.]|uniref:hypothetical protein n=1 Tax=Succinimonas sp. TaxID=1936151 RepID=UPI00386F60D7